MNGKHIAADLLPSDRPSKQQRRLADMAGMAEDAVAMESTKEPFGGAAQVHMKISHKPASNIEELLTL